MLLTIVGISFCSRAPENYVYNTYKFKDPEPRFFNLDTKNYDAIFYAVYSTYDSVFAGSFLVQSPNLISKSYIYSRRESFNESELTKLGVKYYVTDNTTGSGGQAKLGEIIRKIVKENPNGKYAFLTNESWGYVLAWTIGYANGLSEKTDFYFLADGAGLEKINTYDRFKSASQFRYVEQYVHSRNQAWAVYPDADLWPLLTLGTEANHYSLSARTLGEIYHPDVFELAKKVPRRFESTIYSVMEKASSKERESFSDILLNNKSAIESIFTGAFDDSLVLFLSSSAYASNKERIRCIKNSMNYYKNMGPGYKNWIYSTHPKADFDVPADQVPDGMTLTKILGSGNPAEVYLSVYKQKIAFMGGYFSSVNKGFDEDRVKFMCDSPEMTSWPTFKFFKGVWDKYPQPDGTMGLALIPQK